MITIVHIGWFTIAVGIVLATTIGHASRNRLGFIGLGFVGVGLGVGLCFATALLHVVCAPIGICAETSESTVWGVTYPAIFIPIYWIAIAVGKVIAFHSPECPNPSAGAGVAEVASALKKFRSGIPISETCASCKNLLVVKPAKLKPGRDSAALRVTCDCGLSNGTYVVTDASRFGET